MNDIPLALDAVRSGDVADFVHAERQNFVKTMLDLPVWENLSARIDKFRPDFVVCAARKMPRLVQLMRMQQRSIFSFNSSFVSDFAVEFLGHDLLGGKRVAILDDALNVGSTVENIRSRVDQYGPECIMCYCANCRSGGGAGLKDETEIEYAGPPVDEKTYRRNATRLSQSLWMLNRPLECEFPVFALRNLSADWLEGLWEKLEAWDNKRNFYAVDIMDAFRYGFRRISVLWHPENKLNEKIRIYLDMLKNELVLVPMAFSVQKDLSRKDRIKARYEASLVLAEDFFASFSLPKLPELLQDEAEFLFGSEEAKRMVGLWGESLPREKPLELSLSFYETDWPNIRKKCNPGDPRLLNDCFVAFFHAVAEFYKEETGTDYSRLCKGPTYAELERILDELWQSPESFKTPFFERVSHLLDEHIDNGFVVPMTDDAGQRVFRKGEPHPWLRMSKGIADFVYGELNPEDDLQAQIRQNMSEVQQAKYNRMMLDMEKF